MFYKTYKLIFILNLLDPVILPLFMTTRDALAPGLGLEVIDRDIDCAEHEAFAQVVILIRGVDIVAGTAGPPLFAVNVQIVEIDLPVPEICHCL